MSDAPTQELEQELDADADADALGLALGRLEREAALVESRPDEWEKLAHGELSLEQALGSKAGDPEAERAAAYFRPFDEGEQANLVDGLLASLAAPTHGVQEDAPQEDAPKDDAPQDDAAPSNVVPLAAAKPKPHDPATSKFWWIPGGMLAAAAAAILAWWVWPPSLDVQRLDDPQLAQRDPLPSYVLETDGGLKQLRGDTGGEEVTHHRYQRETPFEWVLRPKTELDETVAVRGFAFVDGGRAGLPLPLDQLTTVAKSGAIRIAGKIGELNLEPGRYTIVLAVARPEQLPNDAREVLDAGDEAGESGTAGSSTTTWMARRIAIVIED